MALARRAAPGEGFPIITMVIGVLTVELIIAEADSLKDKRQVLKSLIAHLRNKFNISVAEVDDHDVWRSAVIGVAAVANDASFVNEVLDKAVNHIEAEPRVELGTYHLEIL